MATNYAKLQSEIQDDPLGRGYSGMTDQQVAGSLNAEDRTVNRSSLSGDEMYQQTDPAEYESLTDAEKDRWLTFTRIDGIDPFAPANEAFVVNLFGNSQDSTTTANLVETRTRTVSRAAELGLGTVRTGDIERARA